MHIIKNIVKLLLHNNLHRYKTMATGSRSRVLISAMNKNDCSIGYASFICLWSRAERHERQKP